MRLAAGERDMCGEAVAVGVADLVRLRGGGDLNQLVAGGEDGDAGLREDFDGGCADGGERGDVVGGEPRACGDDRIAAMGFAAGGNDMAAGANAASLARRMRSSKLPPPVSTCSSMTTASAPSGTGAPVMISSAAPGWSGAEGAGSPARRVPMTGSQSPVAMAAACDGVAVAGGAMEGRKVAVCVDGCCENAMESFVERQLFCVARGFRGEAGACARTRCGGFGVGEDHVGIVRLRGSGFRNAREQPNELDDGRRALLGCASDSADPRMRLHLFGMTFLVQGSKTAPLMWRRRLWWIGLATLPCSSWPACCRSGRGCSSRRRPWGR